MEAVLKMLYLRSLSSPEDLEVTLLIMEKFTQQMETASLQALKSSVEYQPYLTQDSITA